MIVQNISNEPTYGFKRTATMAALNIGALPFMGLSVILHIQVDYFDATTDEPITIIPPKQVPLIADNSTWVDATGTIVPEGDPTAVMTEYDFFMQMLTVPVIIADMVAQKIAWADSLNRFD